MASQARTLFPHQLKFYEAFLAPDAGAHQLLLAPPGLGKGYVAQVVACDVASMGPESRVLVLEPGPLVANFATGVQRHDPSTGVDVIDRRRLREILATPREAGVFSGGSRIVVTSIDFAKQEDVLSLLADTHWALVIVDEAHMAGGQRRRLVERLAENADRMLLMSTTDVEGDLRDSIPNLETVRWSRDEVDSQGRRLFVDIPRFLHVVNYERSEEEVLFARQLLELLDKQIASVETPQRTLVKGVILKALASSPLAIQELLIRQRARLEATAEENEWWGDMAQMPDETSAPGVEPLPPFWTDPETAATALDDLISKLDSLPRDSKAEALHDLVRDLTSGQPERSFAVFTLFMSTAQYLAEILASPEHEVQILTGALPVAERVAAVRRWMACGGALILTDGVSQGLELTTASVAIHYDLPDTALKMEQRWARLDRIGQTEAVHAYVLRDVGRTFDWEEPLLAAHGFGE